MTCLDPKCDSSICLTFQEMMKKDKKLIEQKVANFIPIIGFILELLFEIAGIFIVYYMIELLAPIIVGDNFNNNLLYSMLLIPIIYSLKKLPDIFKSVFVKIAISDKYIICKRGYIRKLIDKLYLKHIDNIELRTTLWGEWFNYGTIDLYSFGGKISLPFIKSPCKIYWELKKKIKPKDMD